MALISRHDRRPAPATLTLTLVLATLAAAFPGSTASAAGGGAAGRISSAGRQLAQIEHRISVEQQGFDAVRARLRQIAARTAGELASYNLLQQRLMNTRDLLQLAQDRYQSQRSALDARARQAFMQGPTSGVEVVLGASSVSDLMYRVEYLNAVTRSDATVASRTEALASQLQAQQRQQDALFQTSAASLTRLTAKQDRLGAAFTLEQSRMQALSDSRAQLQSLIQRLQGQLQAQQLAAANAALGAGTGMPYGAWATAFLSSIGAPVSQSNLVSLVAWQSAEGTDATYNPLATTYRMPGSTDFNSVGVQNYASLAQGLDAIHRTLLAPNHGYEQILADLAASTDAMTTGQAINASDWCHGCSSGQYVIALIPIVEQYYAQYSAK